MQDPVATLDELLPWSVPTEHRHQIPAYLSQDSRDIKPRTLFFAVPGLHVDGADYARDAVARGALWVVAERPLDLGVPVFVVRDIRKALSYAAGAFHRWPARSLTVLGITGTDGKSSTTYFVHQILKAAEVEAGFFTTVAYQTGDTVEDNTYRQSTLDALELNRILATMRDNGKTCAIIEATSHGLSHRTARLLHIPFSAAAFTNLSHEHLEFHGTFEAYASDKANLFRALAPGPGLARPFGVINRGDAMASYFASQCPWPVAMYQAFHDGEDPGSNIDLALWARDIGPSPRGLSFTLCSPDGSRAVEVPLAGSFNVENILAALLLASGYLRCSPLDLVPFLGSLQGVAGRMKLVDRGQDYRVVVDYAHTPGSFAKILPMIRKETQGKLIMMFGSAGERDTAKRPIQGAIAARWADVIILTDEDPRLEDSRAIIDDIAQGALSEGFPGILEKVPRRREAMERALSHAGPGDTVLFLGKGHEKSIIYAHGKEAWDEEYQAAEALAAVMRNKPEGAQP